MFPLDIMMQAMRKKKLERREQAMEERKLKLQETLGEERIQQMEANARLGEERQRLYEERLGMDRERYQAATDQKFNEMNARVEGLHDTLASRERIAERGNSTRELLARLRNQRMNAPLAGSVSSGTPVFMVGDWEHKIPFKYNPSMNNYYEFKVYKEEFGDGTSETHVYAVPRNRGVSDKDQASQLRYLSGIVNENTPKPDLYGEPGSMSPIQKTIRGAAVGMINNQFGPKSTKVASPPPAPPGAATDEYGRWISRGGAGTAGAAQVPVGTNPVTSPRKAVEEWLGQIQGMSMKNAEDLIERARSEAMNQPWDKSMSAEEFAARRARMIAAMDAALEEYRRSRGVAR